jgi:alpha/beta superfamily hydrolase
MNPFPLEKSHELFIEGPLGPLQAITSYADDASEPLTIALICHPHPLKDGTMHNKVVTTAARACFNRGIHSIRFNYRGVGQSAGEYGHGKGEIEDLCAIARFAHASLPNARLIIVGFSFGCYIAAAGAEKLKPTQLITIAPAVETFDFDQIKGVKCPWLVIQGEADEIVSPTAVFEWVEKSMNDRIKLIKLPDVSHFFHGQLLVLRELLEHHLL